MLAEYILFVVLRIAFTAFILTKAVIVVSITMDFSDGF